MPTTARRPSKLASGKLCAVDSAIDTTTGTVKLRALFDNTDNALFPNQFVNIHLLIDTLQNQTLVPVAAIQRGAQGTFVFIVSPDKTVAMRTDQIGATDGTNTVVTNGLKPGDTIVVDGADRLRDGSAIEIPAAPQSGHRRAKCGTRRTSSATAVKAAIVSSACSNACRPSSRKN